MTNKFNTGDRVRIVDGKEDLPPFKGSLGTVHKYDGTDVWVDVDGERQIGYYESNLELVERAPGHRPVYFIATTVGGAQFKSADFDPNNAEDLRLALDFRSGPYTGQITFEDNQGREVSIPDGRLDHLMWYNLPTE